MEQTAVATSGSMRARATSRMNETKTRASAGEEQKMASGLQDGPGKCLWAALFVCYFQKENPVITIKRPYYAADFLEKSVFYRAGPQTRTHTLLATTHRNRSEHGPDWEEKERGREGQADALSADGGVTGCGSVMNAEYAEECAELQKVC